MPTLRCLTPTALAVALIAVACTSDSRTIANRPSARDTPDMVNVVSPPAATPMRAPDAFRVKFATSKGDVVIAIKRALAPRGADRFHELVSIGYFSGVRFYRMVPGFVAQFGISGNPAVNASWNEATFPDEPMRTSNTRGTVAFAASGANSRATQLFFSTGDNVKKLDRQRMFAPIGRIVEGMDVVERLTSEYGEQPNHARIVREGNTYLQKWFPALDSIVSATIVP